MPRVVHRDDGLCSRSNFSRYFLGIEIERIPADVCEYRSRALIENAVRGRAERHGRRDRFIAWRKTSHKGRRMQRRSSRTEADGILSSHPRRKPLFELADLR